MVRPRDSHRCGVCGILIGVALSLLVIPEAHAFDDQEKVQVLQLFEAGKRAFDAERFPEAIQKFRAANEAIPLPVLTLWLARAMERSGDFLAAERAYESALRQSPNELWLGEKQQLAQTDASQTLESLRRKTPRLRITVDKQFGPEPEVLLDNALIPVTDRGSERRVNPGLHIVECRSADENIVRRVTIAENESREIWIRMDHLAVAPNGVSPRDAPASRYHDTGRRSVMRTLGWVGLSASAAGLVLGITTGLLVMNRHEVMEGDCQAGLCDRKKVTALQVDEYNQLRWISATGFISASVLGAAGATLLLTAPSRVQTGTALDLSLAGAHLRGEF